MLNRELFAVVIQTQFVTMYGFYEYFWLQSSLLMIRSICVCVCVCMYFYTYIFFSFRKKKCTY